MATEVEVRVANLEMEQKEQGKVLADQSKVLVEQNTVLSRHTDQLVAIIRDSKELLIVANTIKTLVSTGSMLASFVKTIASVAVGLVTLYVVYHAIKSGDFEALLELKGK